MGFLRSGSTHGEKAQEPEVGIKGKELLVGSSHLGAHIEEWELKGRDMGSEVTFGSQKSYFEVRTQIRGKERVGGHTWG